MGWFLEANFILIGLITLWMAFSTLGTKKVMRAAAYLLLTLWGVAFAYLFLGSTYLFAIQLIVYAGGIVVLFLFSVLLTGHEEFKMDMDFVKENIVQILIALLLFITLTALMIHVFGGYQLTGKEPIILSEQTSPVKGISLTMFNQYNYVLSVIALLLLAAMLGSVKLVLREEEL